MGVGVGPLPHTQSHSRPSHHPFVTPPPPTCTHAHTCPHMPTHAHTCTSHAPHCIMASLHAPQAYVAVQRALQPTLLLAIKRVVGLAPKDAFQRDADRKQLVAVLRPLQELLAVMGRLRAASTAWMWGLASSPTPADDGLDVLGTVTAALVLVLNCKDSLERG